RRVDRRRRITESAVDFSRPVGEYFGRLFVGNDVLEFQPALQKNKEHKQDHGRAETREGDRGAYESLCGRGGYRLRRRCFTGGQGRGQRIATWERGCHLKSRLRSRLGIFFEATKDDTFNQRIDVLD